MEAAVERAIRAMWERYPEALTMDELAEVAILSRFYFSRIFRHATGTSPARFLMAIRLYQAKTLLVATSLSVLEISYQVGYNSLGSFTTSFTRCVGISPARYRDLSRRGLLTLPRCRNSMGGTIYGSLRLSEPHQPDRIHIGLFDSPVMQGNPESNDIVDVHQNYRLDRVPDRELFIRAIAITSHGPLLSSTWQVVQVRPDESVRVDLDLRPMRVTDVPVLLALPELDRPRRMPLPEPRPSQFSSASARSSETAARCFASWEDRR